MLDDAIIAAVNAELHDVGFARMTIESVARRAGAGKVSVYRRWPSRLELAMEAAYRQASDRPLPPEPTTLRAELLALFRHMVTQFSGPTGEALRGIIAEALDSRGSELALRSKSHSAQLMRDIVIRAAARGEPVDPNLSALRLQAPLAVLQMQLLIRNTPLDDDVIVGLVDEVALPLILRD